MPYKDSIKQKQAQHESYLRNIDKVRQRTTVRRHGMREFIRELKGNGPCLDCDCELEWPPFVLDYHHRNPSEKVGSIRKMIAENRSKEMILGEIEKCDLICSNCHRIREYSPL